MKFLHKKTPTPKKKSVQSIPPEKQGGDAQTVKRKARRSQGRSLSERLQPTKKILAIELLRDMMLGAVVEKRGGKIRVLNFVWVERAAEGEDLPAAANVSELVERLNYEGNSVVLVTTMARSVQLPMNRQKADKLRPHQLCDVLRWEVEPFTGITGTAALVGAVKGDPAVSEEKILLMDEDEVEIEINVSAIERNVYRAIKQILKRCGLKLLHIYPPEVCFFMPAFMEQVDASLAVFDIGVDYANFTILKGKQPKQITTYPLGQEVLLDFIGVADDGDVERSLQFLLNQVPGPLPMLLTGIGAARKEIVEYLDQHSPHGVKPFLLQREGGFVRKDDGGANTMYCRVVGAAVREVFPVKWRQIGITDAVPLPVRIKQSAYVVPLIVALLMMGGLFGHYAYMKRVKASYSEQNKELQKTLKEWKSKQQAYDSKKKKRTEIQRKVSLYKKRLRFLEQGTDDNLIHVEKVLRAFYHLPSQMCLHGISQKDSTFVLQGFADDVESVSRYAVFLQKYPWCESVKITELKEEEERKIVFQIDLITKEEKKKS